MASLSVANVTKVLGSSCTRVQVGNNADYFRCHYTKSNLTDDHRSISSKKLQKQNFKALGHYTCMQCGTSHLQTVQENILLHIILVTYRKFTTGPLYLHAVWYLPFTNSTRKHTVTYHFSDLQDVYSGNRQIHIKCQLQYLHPLQISTSGKCHCIIIHQITKATEYIG